MDHEGIRQRRAVSSSRSLRHTGPASEIAIRSPNEGSTHTLELNAGCHAQPLHLAPTTTIVEGLFRTIDNIEKDRFENGGWDTPTKAANAFLAALHDFFTHFGIKIELLEKRKDIVREGEIEAFLSVMSMHKWYHHHYVFYNIETHAQEKLEIFLPNMPKHAIKDFLWYWQALLDIKEGKSSVEELVSLMVITRQSTQLIVLQLQGQHQPYIGHEHGL